MYLYHGFLRIYRNDIQLLCVAIANDAFLLAFFSIFYRIRLHFSSLSIDAWSRSFVLGSIRADLEKKKGSRSRQVRETIFKSFDPLSSISPHGLCRARVARI